MKILWMTFKDGSHPEAGGAEVVNEELAKRLAADGHKVTFIVGGFIGGKAEDRRDGYTIIRLGRRYDLYWKAYKYYKANLVGKFDLVIDEVNTMPFFANRYVQEPVVVFAHMLCRQIWFYQLPLPISLGGYVLEPLYLRFINKSPVVTISESTAKGLQSVGFKDIKIISEGISLKPLTRLGEKSVKQDPTILSFGAMRPMKQTLHQLRAFELAKQKMPKLKFEMAGDSSGKYGEKVLAAIEASPYIDDIIFHGQVDNTKKLKLMRSAHAILQTSVKEGWGLTITEANSQGTPAVAYNSDGLRDSIRDDETGLLAKQNNPQSLADEIVTLFSNQKRYAGLRESAWRWSKEITFDKSYEEFKKAISA